MTSSMGDKACGYDYDLEDSAQYLHIKSNVFVFMIDQVTKVIPFKGSIS